MVEQQSSKLPAWVRFLLPLLFFIQTYSLAYKLTRAHRSVPKNNFISTLTSARFYSGGATLPPLSRLKPAYKSIAKSLDPVPGAALGMR
jgi:hypothetical protein